jgi:lambda repressor-like predicted transcriptional regulator
MDLRHLRHGHATSELLISYNHNGQRSEIQNPRTRITPRHESAFANDLMVTRAEYLNRSLSRRQPWLADGISRRTWERRQHKGNAVEATQTKNQNPHEASAGAGKSGAVNSAKESLRRGAGAKMTRAEYLERSLSKLQPWLEEGISRRTWERRQRKIKIALGTRAKRSIATAGETREEGGHIATRSAGLTTPTQGDKKLLHRQDRELLMIGVHDYLDAQGIRDPNAQELSRAIRAIELPERIRHLDVNALVRLYRRARDRLPPSYDRWIGLIEKWDKTYSRKRARGLVDRLINALADRPRRFLDRMFDSLELKIYSDRKKVRRLEEECERLKNDDLHIPDFRPPKTDAAKERVYAALAGGPKTKKQLARMLGVTVGAISNVGLRLRAEGRITSIWRDGKFMWVRRSSDTQFIAARDAIVEALKKGPMTKSALARETGKGIPTIKSALHRHLLANKTVIRTKFGVYALAGTQSPYVSRGDAIVAALKKGPLSFQALAREINNPPSSVPQFLEPLLAKGKVIRIKRGIYALHGSAPAYIPTSDAIISALTKKPMKLGPLVQHVIEFTKGTRSRSSIRTVLSRLKRLGTVEQDRRWGAYHLVRYTRPMRR